MTRYPAPPNSPGLNGNLVAFAVLTDDFDDEEFLTSRAMFHCWSDRPRGRRASNRRPGRRRSAAKPSSHHSLARR